MPDVNNLSLNFNLIAMKKKSITLLIVSLFGIFCAVTIPNILRAAYNLLFSVSTETLQSILIVVLIMVAISIGFMVLSEATTKIEEG